MNDREDRFRRSEVQGYRATDQLALDLHWSWKHTADQLWRSLDSELWELTHNPWVVLQTVSQEKLQNVADDPAVQKLLEELLQEQRSALESPAWFQQAHPDSKLSGMAYFSMEFMLSEALPIQERFAEDGKTAAALIRWMRELERPWPAVRFGSLTVERENDQFVFAVQVYLDEPDPDAVSVELYADTADEPFRRMMDRGQPLVGAHGYMYSARVPADRPAYDYTPRIIPSRPGALVPLEANQILWQR